MSDVYSHEIRGSLERYREYARQHGQAVATGDSLHANRALADLLRVRREIRTLGPAAVQSLFALLDATEPEVRLQAAIDALEFAPADGQRVLAELAAGSDGVHPLIAHDADMSLTLWREGSFKVPWW